MLSSDGTHIIASRMVVQGTNIKNANDEKIFVQDLRTACASSGLDATVFHPYFVFFDQVINNQDQLIMNSRETRSIKN